MTCFRPLRAYRSAEKTLLGKRAITFNPHKSYVEGSSLYVPCGSCIGCRVAKSREWALRCSHEAKMWEHNCFVTLTYDDKNLPASGSVSRRDLQLFMKRLRDKCGHKIRFFGCGEYSPINLRPHYHLLLFNHYFTDQKLFKKTPKSTLYTSNLLQKLWPHGFSTIGPLNYTTAAYTAQYAIKKIGGDRAAEHYTRPHPVTGKLVRVEPEFIQMSNRPGIGTLWFQRFKTDAFPSDFLIVDGRKHPVPRFYDKKLEMEAAAELEQIKRVRKANANKQRANSTPQRLAIREEVLTARVKLQPRKLLGE